MPFHTDAVQAVGALPVDFARQRGRRDERHRAQVRRPDRRRRAAARPRRRLHPAAARRRPGARRPLGHARTCRARPGSPRPPRSPSRAEPEQADGSTALRDAADRRGAGAGARRGRERRPGRSPARHRAPVLPRLRGRLAADAARRPRHRVLDRLGLLGRDRPALARADRHGRRGRAGPRLAALLARPHLDRGRRRRGDRGDRARSSSGRAGPGSCRCERVGERCR